MERQGKVLTCRLTSLLGRVGTAADRSSVRGLRVGKLDVLRVWLTLSLGASQGLLLLICTLLFGRSMLAGWLPGFGGFFFGRLLLHSLSIDYLVFLSLFK